MPDSDTSIRLICFDLDDTLWPCAPVIQAAEERLYTWLCRQAGRLTEHHDIPSLREHRLQLARLRPSLAHDMTALRIHSLRELLQEHGYEPDWAHEAVEVFLSARNAVTPYEDVIPVLMELRERFTLVSVTNGNADVASTPLKDCFHLSLSAAAVGAAKPDPAIFHAAMNRYGVKPTQCLHIGDDPHLDIGAARALGMRTLWINRGQREWPRDLEPAEDMLADLRDLPAWLEE